MSRSRSFVRAALWVIPLSLFSEAALGQRNLATATAPAPVGERVALVIGNSSYKDSPLANPVNDATDMAAALQGMGFKVILKRNADTREMRQAIREFGVELRRAEVGLFFFAGHGVQIKGSNYLVPVRTDIQSEADVEDLAIDANYALRTMEEAQAKVSIVILDACRNNPFARSFRSTSRGLAQMTAAAGSLIAFATAPGSVASDGSGRNGLYTQHLLANMKGPDADILKVFQRTRAGVVKETGGKQTPWESTSLVGDFYFRPPGGAQPTNVATAPAAAPLPISSTAATPPGPIAQTQVATAAPSTAATRPTGAPGSIAAMSPGTVFRDCDACPEMVVIPAGRFTMGSPESEPQRDANEGPAHTVTIARAFAAGKYEVTFEEWDACVREGGCRHRPSDNAWGRGKRPVMNVSWHDAKQYTEWLSRKTGKKYRLLTEAEWEYVARAGTTSSFSFGAVITPQQANYDANVSFAGSPMAASRGRTAPVGSYPANAFGLHDVHGNVWEWTEDCANNDYNDAPADGSAWMSGDCSQRMLRGGSWSLNATFLRSANRYWNNPVNRSLNDGLRVARTD